MNDSSTPPPKIKRYSSEDMEMMILREKHENFSHSVDALTKSLNAAQDNIKQLSVTVENLSVKVGVLSDICWKGGGTVIVLILSSFVTWYLKK